MTKRAWQGNAWSAGKCGVAAGLVMLFGGAAAIVADQAITHEIKGKNEYKIVGGWAAIAPNEFQAQAMMFSLAGVPVTLLGLLSMAAGTFPLPEKKDKSGPTPK